MHRGGGRSCVSSTGRMKRILTAIVLIALVVPAHLLRQALDGHSLRRSRRHARRPGVPPALRRRRHPIPLWWTLSAIALFFLATFYRPQDTITVVAFSALLLFAWTAFRTPLERVLRQTAAGPSCSSISPTRSRSSRSSGTATGDGTVLLLFLFLCVWSGDIAALYVGKRFGRHKLAPELSPNKTWEGAIASVVASFIFGMGLVLYGDWFTAHGSSFTRLHTNAPIWQSVLLAVLLNAAAQFGDLLESAIKRGAGVKDSGTLLPGHGGILDRIDALLLAAPVLWFVLLLREFFALGSF